MLAEKTPEELLIRNSRTPTHLDFPLHDTASFQMGKICKWWNHFNPVHKQAWYGWKTRQRLWKQLSSSCFILIRKQILVVKLECSSKPKPNPWSTCWLWKMGFSWLLFHIFPLLYYIQEIGLEANFFLVLQIISLWVTFLMGTELPHWSFTVGP